MPVRHARVTRADQLPTLHCPSAMQPGLPVGGACALIQHLRLAACRRKHHLHIAVATAGSILCALNGQRAVLPRVGGPFKLHEAILQQEWAAGWLAHWRRLDGQARRLLLLCLLRFLLRGGSACAAVAVARTRPAAESDHSRGAGHARGQHLGDC